MRTEFWMQAVQHVVAVGVIGYAIYSSIKKARQ